LGCYGSLQKCNRIEIITLVYRILYGKIEHAVSPLSNSSSHPKPRQGESPLKTGKV